MPIVSGAKAATTLSGSGGTLSQQAAAVADGTSGANVAMEALALLNDAGAFDRLRESLSVRNGMIIDAPLVGQLLTPIIVMLRALLLAHIATNQLLGRGPATWANTDTMQFQDVLTLALSTMPSGATDPNTLQ